MPRVKEVEFWSFLDALRAASDNHQKIEPKDKDAWKAYLKAHRMSEPMLEEFAKARFMEYQKVIIKADSEWDGFYIYSVDDEGALKWQS
jgi:hypothetical protein